VQCPDPEQEIIGLETMRGLPQRAPRVNGAADHVHTQRTPYQTIDDLPLRQAAPHSLEGEQALRRLSSRPRPTC
jgi:hypothetical protein